MAQVKGSKGTAPNRSVSAGQVENAVKMSVLWSLDLHTATWLDTFFMMQWHSCTFPFKCLLKDSYNDTSFKKHLERLLTSVYGRRRGEPLISVTRLYIHRGRFRSERYHVEYVCWGGFHWNAPSLATHVQQRSRNLRIEKHVAVQLQKNNQQQDIVMKQVMKCFIRLTQLQFDKKMY